MKILKKRLTLMVALSIVASLATACGGGAASSSSSSTSGSETTKKSDSTATGAVEVSIWHYFENEAEALENLVDKYNETQKDIKITCTYVSRDELMKQYTIGAVSGELPDIGMVDSPDMASYISLGVFENITDDLKNWDDLKNFYPGPLSSCMDSDGNYYGLPNNSNCLALVSNMDLLKKAGFTEPPKTWDEFKKIAAATTNPTDSVYGFAMSAVSNEEGTFQYIPWLYSSGATVSTLGSDKAIKSLTLLTDLVKGGYMSKEVVNWTQGDAYNAFCAGKAAMFESGTWQVSTIDTGVNKTFNYKYSLLPKDEKYSSVIGGENFGVCVGSKAKEACVEFLKYMQSAQNNADWCELAGKIPVRSDAATLKDFWTADERYAVFTEGMKYAVARGPHEEWPTISKAVYTAVQASLIGNKTPQQAMTDAAAVVDPIIKAKPIAE